jgi:hypothetical protein
MSEITISGWPELLAGVLLFLVVLGTGIQKLVKSSKTENAETFIISTMHEELARLSTQNGILAMELNKLQLEVIKLTKEIHTLTLENQRLHLQISQITSTVFNKANQPRKEE